MDSGRSNRKFPGYTTTELKAAVACGRTTKMDEMKAEIAAREAGTSKPFVVPQL